MLALQDPSSLEVSVHEFKTGPESMVFSGCIQQLIGTEQEESEGLSGSAGKARGAGAVTAVTLELGKKAVRT